MNNQVITYEEMIEHGHLRAKQAQMAMGKQVNKDFSLIVVGLKDIAEGCPPIRQEQLNRRILQIEKLLAKYLRSEENV